VRNGGADARAGPSRGGAEGSPRTSAAEGCQRGPWGAGVSPTLVRTLQYANGVPTRSRAAAPGGVAVRRCTEGRST